MPNKIPQTFIPALKELLKRGKKGKTYAPRKKEFIDGADYWVSKGFVEKLTKKDYKLKPDKVQEAEKLITPPRKEKEVLKEGIPTRVKDVYLALKPEIDALWNEFRSFKQIVVDKFAQLLPVGRKIDERKFMRTIREEYRRLQQSSPTAPYIQIKSLRESVTRRLTVDRDLFDSMLVSIATRDPYSVQLSTGTGDKGTGIYYGRGECHAIIIK